MSEMSTMMGSGLSVKVYGDDLDTLTKIGIGTLRQLSVQLGKNLGNRQPFAHGGIFIQHQTDDLIRLFLPVGSEMSTMMGSGLSVKVYGDDLDTLTKITQDICDLAATIPGSAPKM